MKGWQYVKDAAELIGWGILAVICTAAWYFVINTVGSIAYLLFAI